MASSKKDVGQWLYQRGNIVDLLQGQGWAKVRTGDYRSVASARKLAKEAAGLADVEIKTSEKDGYLLVTVK